MRSLTRSRDLWSTASSKTSTRGLCSTLSPPFSKWVFRRTRTMCKSKTSTLCSALCSAWRSFWSQRARTTTRTPSTASSRLWMMGGPRTVCSSTSAEDFLILRNGLTHWYSICPSLHSSRRTISIRCLSWVALFFSSSEILIRCLFRTILLMCC